MCGAAGAGHSLISDSRSLPKPGGDWLDEPISQFGSLAWEGLKWPSWPIVKSVVEATAEPLTCTKEEAPRFVFGQGLSFMVAGAGRLMFGLAAVSRNALLHRSDTGLSDLMSPVLREVKSQHVSCGRHRSEASEGLSSILFCFLSPR